MNLAHHNYQNTLGTPNVTQAKTNWLNAQKAHNNTLNTPAYLRNAGYHAI